MQRKIRTTRSLGRPGQGGVLFSSPSINAREAPPRLNGYQDVFFSRPESKIIMRPFSELSTARRPAPASLWRPLIRQCGDATSRKSFRVSHIYAAAVSAIVLDRFSVERMNDEMTMIRNMKGMAKKKRHIIDHSLLLRFAMRPWQLRRYLHNSFLLPQ